MSSKVATSPPSDSSSASSTATSSTNNNQLGEKVIMSSQPVTLADNLNDSLGDGNLMDSSLSSHENKENKDGHNIAPINNTIHKIPGANSNSNNSSTTTIIGNSNSASTLKGLTLSNGGSMPDENKRSCNRCQNCLGFSSHEWRNTCTSCRCPRSCHDVSIGARCCGFHRAGFDPSTVTPNQPQSASTASPTKHAASTLPPTTPNPNPPPTTQPPPPSGNAPSIDNSVPSGSFSAMPKLNSNGVTCSRNAAAEAEGYSWMPPVSFIFILY